MVYNPSLSEYSLNQQAPVIPEIAESILDWLEKSGRLIEREAEAPIAKEEIDPWSHLINEAAGDDGDGGDDDLDLQLEDEDQGEWGKL